MSTRRRPYLRPTWVQVRILGRASSATRRWTKRRFREPPSTVAFIFRGPDRSPIHGFHTRIGLRCRGSRTSIEGATRHGSRRRDITWSTRDLSSNVLRVAGSTAPVCGSTKLRALRARTGLSLAPVDRMMASRAVRALTRRPPTHDLVSPFKVSVSVGSARRPPSLQAPAITPSPRGSSQPRLVPAAKCRNAKRQ